MSALEPLLVEHLLTMARAAAADRGVGLSTVAREAHGTPTFFADIEARRTSFTMRKYDDTMTWFEDDSNWRDVTNRPAIDPPLSECYPFVRPKPRRKPNGTTKAQGRAEGKGKARVRSPRVVRRKAV